MYCFKLKKIQIILILSMCLMFSGCAASEDTWETLPTNDTEVTPKSNDTEENLISDDTDDDVGGGVLPMDSEITLSDSGVDNIYIAYDPRTRACALYDAANERYVDMPVYRYIGKFGKNNLAPAYTSGFYGYIDPKGNVVIDFYFEYAGEFQDNNYAIAGTSNGQGVIDTNGNYVIQPQYKELEWVTDSILTYAVPQYSVLGYVTDYYGLCDINGNEISDAIYEEISIQDQYIYAAVTDEADGYFVYSIAGEPIFGEGTTLKQVKCVKLSPNGIFLALCEGRSEPNSYGYYYGKYGSGQWYSYLNRDFQMLSYGPYGEAGLFSSFGYAVVSIQHDEYESHWGIIDEYGNYLSDLPDLNLGRAENWYTTCNGFFAVARGYTGSYGMETENIIALVNIKSGEITEYQSIQFVDSTDCTIVQDLNTDLYGMYVKDVQNLACVYDSITLDEDNNFVLIRGGTEETISADEIMGEEQL